MLLRIDAFILFFIIIAIRIWNLTHCFSFVYGDLLKNRDKIESKVIVFMELNWIGEYEKVEENNCATYFLVVVLFDLIA